MLGLLLGHVPWWVWALLTTIAAVAVLRLLGPRGALAVLVGGAGIALYSWARSAGYHEAEDRRRQREARSLDERQRIQRSVRSANDEDLRRRLERWSK